MAFPRRMREAPPVPIEETETAPLLGHSSEDTSEESHNVLWNLVTGTASIAQIGIWVFFILVWTNILQQPIILFTAHPLLAISGLLLQVQGILILQPTSTAGQKQKGTHFHYIIQLTSTLCFLTAFIIIEVNKGTHPHFTSAHAILGLFTVIFVTAQSLFGVAQYFLPETLFGSVENGKKFYKYHRWSGYVALLVLELPTAIWGATQTGYSIAFLNIPVWSVVTAAVAVVIGAGARIRTHKLGLGEA